MIGGISNDVISLASYLTKDFDILLLYGEKEKDEEDALFLLDVFPGLTVKKIKTLKRQINPLNDLPAFFDIRREIKNFKCDIVHTHGAKSGMLGRLAAHFEKVPCIVHTFHGHLFHSYYNSIISKFIIITERWLGRITSRIIAISEWQKHELVDVFKIASKDKVSLIYLGLDTNNYQQHKLSGRKNFRAHYNLMGEDVAIGITGRIVSVKNLNLFIDVVKQIIPAQKNAKFFIIGDGEKKQHLQKQLTAAGIRWCNADNLDVDAKVFFTSWINNIEQQIHGLDVIVLTSVNEGTPLSLIEAQICAKPVVATNVGGVRDTFEDGLSGFLVNSGDIENFVKKLDLLINNQELREKMGRHGCRFARQRFSKETEVQLFRELYNNCPVT